MQVEFLPSEMTQAGYFIDDTTVFNWRGPNLQVYPARWVSFNRFIDAGFAMNQFSDMFHVNIKPLPDLADFVEGVIEAGGVVEGAGDPTNIRTTPISAD